MTSRGGNDLEGNEFSNPGKADPEMAADECREFGKMTGGLRNGKKANMDFKELISIAGYGIESIGVLVIIAGTAVSSFRFLASYRGTPEGTAYANFRRQLGRSIIVGLEFLIAGDIIRTVIVADTLTNVTILGLIILIRTFLSFSLHLEVEGRWPWQRAVTEEKR